MPKKSTKYDKMKHKNISGMTKRKGSSGSKMGKPTFGKRKKNKSDSAENSDFTHELEYLDSDITDNRKINAAQKYVKDISFDENDSEAELSQFDRNADETDEEVAFNNEIEEDGSDNDVEKGLELDEKIQDINTSDNERSDCDSDGSSLDHESSMHKKSLGKLKDTDPEFYTFLQENDRSLLQFSGSDSEGDDDDDGDNDLLHKPPATLEVDSADSDFEEEGKSDTKRGNVSLAMVAKWRQDLSDEASLENISIAVHAFEAALDRVTGEQNSIYVVEGSSVFNAVVGMCVIDLIPSITKFLKLHHLKQPEKSKKWIKLRHVVKTYLSNLIKLIDGVTSSQIINVLMKHLHSALYLVTPFNKLTRTSLRSLAKLWSTSEEATRVLAYLCILRLVTVLKDSKSVLDHTLKLMYMSFVRGTKFVSVSTLPQINFMRRSLADLLTVNPVLSYQHAFLYIRQLSILLRNAVTIFKKEKFQAVYNWQFICSLELWTELLCHKKPELEPLLYPLVTIIVGTINLIPTAQYIPLRFHCVRMLIKLTRETDVFVPVFPFITEALSIVDLKSMKHSKVSIKPFDFTCVLRLTKKSMAETSFTDAVVENVSDLLLDAAYNHHTSIAFPDLVVPMIMKIKTIVKDVKNPKLCSKLKQILQKICDTASLINNERNKFCVALSETDKIKAWEAEMRLKKTPIGHMWQEKNKKLLPKNVSKKAVVSDNKDPESDIPSIKKIVKRKVKFGDEGPTELFPSDDEDKLTTKLCNLPKQESAPKRKKKFKPKDMKKKEEPEESVNSDEAVDIVEEFDINNF